VNKPRCTLIEDAARYHHKVVRGITFDMERLVVDIQGPGFSYARVIFRDVRGFRVLDEGDLCDFWEGGYHEKTGWLYEVHAGGWLELESTRPIISNHLMPNLREFFIADNTCLNVLCPAPPEIVDLGGDWPQQEDA
jgi:hypothetical protein